MQYKRILMSCLIVILILCTSVFSIGAADETTPLELAVEVSSSTAVANEPFVLQAGESFTVSISINSNSGFTALDFKLAYDSEALTLVKTEVADLIKAEALYVKSTENSITVRNTDWTTKITESGKLMTLTFKVNDGYHGSADVAIAYAFFADGDNIVDSVVKANTTAAHVHKLDAAPVVEEATCLAPSKTTYTCSECNENVVVVGTELADHVYGEWTTVAEATCTDKGSEERICTVCNTAKETRDTDPLNHSYSTEWTVDVKATCVTPGSQSHHCIRCGDKADVTEIKADGHDFGDWTVEKAATCTEKGSEKRTCKREGCTEAETRDIDPAGHKSVAYDEVEATKEAEGYTGGTYCSVCNAELSARTTIPMLKDYTWIYVLVAVVAVVAIGGGVCAYIFVVKKKKVNG